MERGLDMNDTSLKRFNLLRIVTLALLVSTPMDLRAADLGMDAKAATTISPEEGLIESALYVPGSEPIGADEMRVVALGTGMPSARPKQAGACWLVELGNGDKFLFDIGSECHSRIAAQKIPYDYLDKVFITHLHVDHVGDLDSFWLGGATMNRTTPLRVWGPSGPEEKYGTRYSLGRLQEMYGWDLRTRGAVIDPRGMAMQINEFDYSGMNEVIYDEDGVVIRSFPAAHGFEGAVCYVLAWNGLEFAYSGDNVPHQWWVDYAKNVDIAVHESFLPSVLLIERQRFTPQEALNVGTQGHTSPEQFGELMSLSKPRMAVAYHVYNDRDTAPVIRERIRKFYDGPLAISLDYMVFNVTRDEIRVRMSDVDREVWPTPATREKQAELDMTKILPLLTGPSRQALLAMPEVVGPIYQEVNERYGTDHEPLTDSLAFKAINALMQLKRSVTESLHWLFSSDA
jgi:ribonuclease Z